MSRSHTVISGDRLTRISTRYYNISTKFSLIIEANPILKERQNKKILSADGLPIVYAGEILTIPDETENIVNPNAVKASPLTINTDNKDGITIKIAGNDFEFYTGFSLTSNIGSLDTVSVDLPNFDKDIYNETFQALSYKQASIYFGKDLFFDGIMLAPVRDTEPNSKILSLTLYPRCGVLSDCTFPVSIYPIEYNGLTLKDIAEEAARIFGIKVEFIGDPGAAFEKVAPEPTTKILDFLVGLAKQRGFLITNNVSGDLLIWKAEITDSLAFFKEGEIPFISCSPSFSPQNYYSEITGLTPATETKAAETYTWKNPFLKNVFRPFTAEVDDIEDSDLQASVEALAGRMFGSVAKYNLQINSLRNKDGIFFKKNKIITAIAPNSDIFIEFDFLIEQSILTRNDESADNASIDLVLPGAYTGSLPEVIPWVQ